MFTSSLPFISLPLDLTFCFWALRIQYIFEISWRRLFTVCWLGPLLKAWITSKYINIHADLDLKRKLHCQLFHTVLFGKGSFYSKRWNERETCWGRVKLRTSSFETNLAVCHTGNCLHGDTSHKNKCPVWQYQGVSLTTASVPLTYVNCKIQDKVECAFFMQKKMCIQKLK